MKYGKDYGVKVDVPWYVKCPLVNRLFNTMKVEMSFTTFSSDGGPVIGVSGTFRVPFDDHGGFIESSVLGGYCIPFHDGRLDVTYGIYGKVTLLDVNHRKVSDKPSAGTMVKTKEERIRPGTWYGGELFCIKFGKKLLLQ